MEIFLIEHSQLQNKKQDHRPKKKGPELLLSLCTLEGGATLQGPQMPISPLPMRHPGPF